VPVKRDSGKLGFQVGIHQPQKRMARGSLASPRHSKGNSSPPRVALIFTYSPRPPKRSLITCTLLSHAWFRHGKPKPASIDLRSE
jgi:hypothetical protein